LRAGRVKLLLVSARFDHQGKFVGWNAAGYLDLLRAAVYRAGRRAAAFDKDDPYFQTVSNGWGALKACLRQSLPDFESPTEQVSLGPIF